MDPTWAVLLDAQLWPLAIALLGDLWKRKPPLWAAWISLGRITVIILGLYYSVRKVVQMSKMCQKVEKVCKKGGIILYTLLSTINNPKVNSTPKIIKTTSKQATESNACPKNKTKQQTRACQEYHHRPNICKWWRKRKEDWMSFTACQMMNHNK